MYKELIKVNNKIYEKPNKKQAEDLKRYFTKKIHEQPINT